MQRGIQPGYGLNPRLDTCGQKILFDMGKSDTFSDNAKTLGSDLPAIGFAGLLHNCDLDDELGMLYHNVCRLNRADRTNTHRSETGCGVRRWSHRILAAAGLKIC